MPVAISRQTSQLLPSLVTRPNASSSASTRAHSPLGIQRNLIRDSAMYCPNMPNSTPCAPESPSKAPATKSRSSGIVSCGDADQRKLTTRRYASSQRWVSAARARGLTAVSSRSGRTPRAARAVTRLIRPLTSAKGSPTRRATSIASSACGSASGSPRSTRAVTAGERTRERRRLRQAGQQRHRVVGGPDRIVPRRGEPASAPSQLSTSASRSGSPTPRARSFASARRSTRDRTGALPCCSARARRARGSGHGRRRRVPRRVRTSRWPRQGRPRDRGLARLEQQLERVRGERRIVVAVPDRLEVVIGGDLRRLPLPAGAAAFDPLGDGPVQPAPLRAREVW